MFRSILAGIVLMATTATGFAGSSDAFLKHIDGRWIGPGEIVAGKYKGTRFTCDLAGGTENRPSSMELDGTCRVGLFSQKMTAKVSHNGSTYQGAFLDGAKGAGLDISSGVIEGDRMVFGLDRKSLNGAMVARMESRDALNVTISVKVDGKLVPVLGMKLKREAGSVRQTALQED
ncbi:hypothetical protein FPY71_05995 [Aureimonas fodinaquatilis]|uniref:Uncharacterized protein n=2 Tax=Aureimonas fodinaquatilis TaxID=2565783 RepID=A0A5B0E1Q0_9HYPH|nr:hypothetical protein FPY71_05995 [Aureimonas fodinaquatilis]